MKIIQIQSKNMRDTFADSDCNCKLIEKKKKTKVKISKNHKLNKIDAKSRSTCCIAY